MADPSKAEALQELGSRGQLPPDMQRAYDAAVKRGLIKGAKAEPRSFGETATGVAKSLGSGVVLGLEGLAGMQGTANEWVGKGLQWGQHKLGIPDPPPIPPHEPGMLERAVTATRPPSFEDIDAFRRENIGELHQPETPYEEGAQTLGEFVPSILSGPPGMMRQAITRTPQRVVTHALTQGPRRIAQHAVTQTVLPAAGSEIAGSLTEGTAYEPYARVVGAMLGGASSPILHSAGRPGGPLSDISSKAARYAADVAPSPGQVSELQRLGPRATLADISPEWMSVARGAATRPGNRDAVVQALIDRQAGSNRRLGADLDTSLGSVRNPTRVERYLDNSRRALSPEYERAMIGAHAVDTQPIADALDAQIVNTRGAAQAALRAVRDDLNIPGQNVLDPHPQALHASREAIDGILYGGSPLDPNVARNLRTARRMIDAELTRAVPGIKDIDAQYAELHRQSEGLTRGSQVLDSGKTAIRPEDLAEEMAQGALPQGTQIGPSGVPRQMQTGARAEIDRIVGTSANDAGALQRLVKGEGDWNRDKLRTLFGPQADDALNAIDRETVFNDTTNRVARGSDTATTSRFGDFLDAAGEPPTFPREASATGTALHYGHRALQRMFGANAEARARRLGSELGLASVATGAERDALIAAIQDYARRRSMGLPIGPTVARSAMIQALMNQAQKNGGGGY